MKQTKIKRGDSLIISQAGNYFCGVVVGIQEPKTLYEVIVSELYPDIKTGKSHTTIKIGNKVVVNPHEIRQAITEDIDDISPHLSLIIENGTIVSARRVDGEEQDMIIKVSDDDDGTVKMFSVNTHSFSQVCKQENENTTLI